MSDRTNDHGRLPFGRRNLKNLARCPKAQVKIARCQVWSVHTLRLVSTARPVKQTPITKSCADLIDRHADYTFGTFSFIGEGGLPL